MFSTSHCTILAREQIVLTPDLMILSLWIILTNEPTLQCFKQSIKNMFVHKIILDNKNILFHVIIVLSSYQFQYEDHNGNESQVTTVPSSELNVTSYFVPVTFNI